MSLLHEIQAAVIDSRNDLSSIFLKLRLLAARLGGNSLEKWVEYESEGYPKSVEVPSYRVIPIVYIGQFSGPLGSGLKNMPIPTILLETLKLDAWVDQKIRQSIASIEHLIHGREKSHSLTVDASNLVPILQDKVVKNYNCFAVEGQISSADLAEIQQVVRSRILTLTIELEKSIPTAADISFDSHKISEKIFSGEVNQVFNQVVHGDVHQMQVVVSNIEQGDAAALISYLVNAGIPANDAKEVAEIASSEKPGDSAEPFGDKLKTWLADNVRKSVDGTWKIGVSVIGGVLKEALLKYYGIK